jgi:hypothetical protein
MAPWWWGAEWEVVAVVVAAAPVGIWIRIGSCPNRGWHPDKYMLSHDLFHKSHAKQKKNQKSYWLLQDRVSLLIGSNSLNKSLAKKNEKMYSV